MVNEPDFLQPKPKPKNDEIGVLTPGSIMILLGVVALVAVFGIQLSQQNQIQPMPGEVPPSFTMTTFDGETISLDDYRGHIVVLNFWGSWCGPCRAEAPDLQDIYETYRDQGVIVFGVNWLDVHDSALEFIDDFDITYPNAPDVGEKVAGAYNIEGAPETFIIGRDGIVKHAELGPVNYDVLATQLDNLLADDNS